MALAHIFANMTATVPNAAPDALAALLALRRPLVMGILNVTPDSFADGGRYLDAQAAIGHAAAMASDGADILDIGAESTRPYGGAKPVSAEEELARLTPVLPAMVKFGVPVSVDSNKAKVAAWALDHGAGIVNDVWGLQRDPDMAKLVAARGVPIVVMHNRDKADGAIDIIADVTAFFGRSLEIATQAGIARDRIILDPGIGFGKTPEQSIVCIAKLGEFDPFWPSASGRRLAQTVYKFCDQGRPGRAHRRLYRQSSRSGKERRNHRARARHCGNGAGATRDGGHRGGAMSDRIFINGLALHAYHGVMPYEGKVGQTFTVDLKLDIDLAAAARSDKVVDTVSYDKVVECVSTAFTAHKFRLIEAAAGSVADAVLAKFSRVRAIEVTIHKPHAPIAATFSDVGVTLVRARGGSRP